MVLTSYKPLTDTSQPALTSLTDRDDHQSAPDSARNAKLSTDSVCSDMGRKFSHSSSRKHSQQDTGKLLSPAAHNSDITENSNSEVLRPGTDASLPQVETDEDGCGLSQTNYPGGERTPMQQPVPSAAGTPPDMQVSVASQSQPFPMDPLKQQRTRHYSDSKTTRHWRSNVTNKHGSVKSLQENNMEAETGPLSTNFSNIHLLRMQGHSSVSSSGYSSRCPSPIGPHTASSPLAEVSHIYTPEQQKTEQHNSDSKTTKHQKTEVRNKHSVSVVLTVFSDKIDEYTQVEMRTLY